MLNKIIEQRKTDKKQEIDKFKMLLDHASKRLKPFIHMLYLHINLLLPYCTASFALFEHIQENSF